MRKKAFVKLILSLSLFILPLLLFADMTDRQVMEYVQQAAAQGKSQQQIARELAMRGVSTVQLQRVKRQYEQSQSSGNNAASKNSSSVNRNQKTQNNKNTKGKNGNADEEEETLDMKSGQRRNQTGMTSTNKNNRSTDEMGNENEREAYYYQQQRNLRPRDLMYFIDEYGDTVTVYAQIIEEDKKVFGRDMFLNPNLTFEPNINAATPEDYRLGPGDEVIINVWGNNEDYIRDYISPEGNIIVSNIGPVSLSGMTIKEANNYIKQVFARKYGDIADQNSDISLTLGDLRTIQINIMGEVNAPGTYRLSPFSTLFTALYNAGGPNETGTLRNIAVYRNGRKIATGDIYDFLFNGATSSDIRLQEGDVILVSPYDRLVTLDSGVKRPMTYELKEGETVVDAIGYAGGLTGDAYGGRLNVLRATGDGLTVITVDAQNFANTPLLDGDLIEIGSALNRFDNRIEIKGSVFRPGVYALGNDISTISDLIAKADGLTEDAFLGRVQIMRQAADLSQTMEAVDLAGILSGRVPDLVLQPNDVVIVPSVIELMPKGDVVISGAVGEPGNYPFAKGMTVEDLIVQAGGLLEGASDAKVDISRRIVDSQDTEIHSKIAENFTVTIKDGLVVGADGEDFILEPNDVVDVRFSPSFIEQRRVFIEGEVPFGGSYTLGNRTERLSDLVRRAGGVSQFAYLKGANLKRKFTEEEKRMREETVRLAQSGEESDSITEQYMFTSDYYPVGINLELALAHPGGPQDLVLQEGDELYIPELVNTVKISGAVFYPNSVIYTPGKKLGYYIDQAGGYGNEADKRGAFVVYMNGQVSKGRGSKIEPGCQIIVPLKEKKDNAANLQKWLAIGSSAASIGTMAASIVNLIK